MAIIAVCIFRAHIFGFIRNFDNIVIVMLCFAFTAASILCIYISVGEIFTAHGKRAAEKKKSQGHSKFSSKDYKIDDIVEMAKKND